MGFYPVADRDNEAKVVAVDIAFHLPGALLFNYPGFPDSCFGNQFSFVIDVGNMFVDRPYVFLKQFRQLFLAQSGGFIPHLDFNAGSPVFSLVEYERVGSG